MNADPVHRILFLRTDRIGDLLMNVPAVCALRRAYPKSWLTVGLHPATKPLLAHHPAVDEILEVAPGTLNGGLRERWRFVKKLRRLRFRTVVISNPDKALHVACFLAGIPERIGYKRKWGFLLTKALPPAALSPAIHEMDKNLALVRLAGVRETGPAAWELPAAAEAVAAVERRLQDLDPTNRTLIAVHPGTSNPRKRWPVQSFAKTCDEIEAGGSRAVLIGGAEENETAGQLVELTRHPPLDLTGKLTLGELMAFLQHPRVRALVSVDSGPVHIAWMSGKPVVALYARDVPGSDPARWGPRQAQSQVIFKPIRAIRPDEIKQALLRAVR